MKIARKLEVFFQIARDKGNEYVKSTSRRDLCVELIESGIPIRKRKGRDLLIRNPLASMIKGCNTYEVELGYSVCDFRESIESKFKDGMSWGNHGDWHLDHIIPIAHFMKDKIYDPKIINALENLQPLWADENLKKSAKA